MRKMSKDPKMNLIIQTFDFTAPPEMQTIVEERFRKLYELPVLIERIEIIVGEDNTDETPRKFCNVRLVTVVSGYLVSQRALTIEDAVEDAANELYKKIRRDIILYGN